MVLVVLEYWSLCGASGIGVCVVLVVHGIGVYVVLVVLESVWC